VNNCIFYGRIPQKSFNRMVDTSFGLLDSNAVPAESNFRFESK
jgi:hypothetical protein